VALSGDGGDEVFAGYRRHRFHVAEERVRARLPLAVRRPMFGTLAALYPKLDWAPRPLRARATLQALSWDSVTAYFNGVAIFRDLDRQALYSPAMKRELNGYRAIDVMLDHATRAGTDEPLALAQYLDMKTYLVGDINTKVDRASMAHSLEVREPLMDHRLVEWAARLPQELRIARGQGKYLLKKAMEPHLPHDVLYRPKHGFTVPISQWFRGPLAQRVRSAVTGHRLAQTGWFDAGALERLVSAHQSGAREHGAQLWSLLMLDAFLANAERSSAVPPLRSVA
jgi:asparagine synthase (glutamine-hydrolysing)